MQKTQTFLLDINNKLNSQLKPYRSEWKRRERLSKLVEQIMRAVKKDDFFQISELVESALAKKVRADPDFSDTVPLLDQLKIYADLRIKDYRKRFIQDLEALAEEAGLPLTIDFPRLASQPGISGRFDFGMRVTTLNGKKLKSIDPKRIISQLQKLTTRLYGRKFDPQGFIDDLSGAYVSLLRKQQGSVGQNVSARELYLEYVMSRQSKTFFSNMEKGRFRGYALDEFSVDLWRFFQSDINTTSDGLQLKQRPGRGSSLWLLDPTGEPRQITNLAFLSVSR